MTDPRGPGSVLKSPDLAILGERVDVHVGRPAIVGVHVGCLATGSAGATEYTDSKKYVKLPAEQSVTTPGGGRVVARMGIVPCSNLEPGTRRPPGPRPTSTNNHNNK